MPAAAPASTVSDTDEGLPTEAIVGVLALLGVGAAGYAATRSRRRRVEPEDVYVASTPVEAGLMTEERDAQTVERQPSVTAQPTVAIREQSRALKLPVTMPATMPATAEEHSRVIDNMVEAAPDEANPFTSRKARRKRARLLLQQHEAAIASANPATSFDWRAYKSEARPPIPAERELETT